MKQPPELVARNFFKLMLQNQLHVCWQVFSKKSQQYFLDWTLKEVYKSQPEAAQQAKLSVKEIKILFENNDASLMKLFWKNFYLAANAAEICYYGYDFDLLQTDNRTAIIQVGIRYPDGRTKQSELTLMNEAGVWRMGFAEMGLKLP